MASFAHRRQVLLFLVAVLLPCTVLVALGVLIFTQERELRERRLADERRLVAREIRQELLGRLDEIGQNEASRLEGDPGQITSTAYSDPAVTLVATLRDGRLVLPWEQDPNAERGRRLLSEARFARAVADGERAEFAGGDRGEAAAAFARALELASDPVQQHYARLLLGRVSTKLERRAEAARQYHAVLTSPSNVTDEFGVALWSYAAARLLETGDAQSSVLDRLAAELDSSRWYSPSQLYLFRALVDTAAATVTDTAVSDRVRLATLALEDRIATAETANLLKRELAGLPISLDPANTAQSTWVLWKPADWLLGVTSSAAEPGAILLALHARELFETLDAVATSEVGATVALEAEPDSDGELLGTEFPGLRVRFAAAAPSMVGGPWNLRRWFYLMVILLVVSVTLSGAYLQWRDMRRELGMAQMRSRFVSSVSHELKTPLTAIRILAETLRLRTPTAEKQSQYLDTIVGESERLTRLLNNVLDFTKIERGAKAYNREPQTLDEIVRASARAMQYPLEQKNFNLIVSISDGIPPMDVDRDAIEQAILNLLANAMKYSGDSRDISLTLEKVGREAVIAVADNGVGIAAEEQERIFDQFYRAKTEENQQIPGTGLGLTLVDHIAKAHEGFVTVESAPGQGSKFGIHLHIERGHE